MSVGPASKPGVRWVGDPTTGHWVDEDGNPASAPAATTDNRVVSVPDAPKQNLNGTPDPLHKWATTDQSSGGDPFHNPGNPAGANPVGTAPAAAGSITSAETVVRAKQLADEAMARHTASGTITASTAGPTVVDRTGTTQPVVTPEFAGRTSAPNPVQVDRIGGAPIANAPTVTAPTVAGPQISQSGAALQFDAAKTYQDILAGKDSLADKQLRDAQDRAAAEQLSIAAGARGQGVVAARRGAATNIGLQQQQNAGQFAEQRAKEIADAAAGLGNIGGVVQGQNLTASGQAIDVNKANAGNTIDVGKANASNTVDVGKANAANAIDVNKSNQATDLAVKQTNAANQLRADLASDDRLQTMLTQAADLKQRAAAGDQSAAVQLNALQANMTTEIAKFNAAQLQTADATNIDSKLRSMGLDDQFVEQTTSLWIQAENNKDQNAIEQLKAQIAAKAAENASNGNFLNFISNLFGGVAKIATSDKRLKEEIVDVDPKSIDDFLKANKDTSQQEWQYKRGEGLPEGRRVGPMAGDLAADKLAAHAVNEEPNGKLSVDFQQMAALALAGLGRVTDRLEKVEGKKKAKPDVTGFLMRGKSR